MAVITLPYRYLERLTRADKKTILDAIAFLGPMWSGWKKTMLMSSSSPTARPLLTGRVARAMRDTWDRDGAARIPGQALWDRIQC